MGTTYAQLSIEDRCRIASLQEQGRSVRQIAAALGRAPSTIAREFRRNAGRKVGYRPAYAHEQARARRWKGSKLERDESLRLVGELIARGVAEPARIYLAGISNGGMMTFRLLCEASELFAGAGTIIANMPAGIGEGCQPKKPLPIVMFNATADPLVPYAGGAVGFAGRRGNVWAAERTAAFMAGVNGCGGPTTQPPAAGAPADATKVVRLDWSGCSSGQPVTLYRIEGGGHQVFGRPDILPAVLGLGTQQISAPEAIMELFAAAGR